ncbi:UNVERIFIED_CONTAM: hypothetical protein Sangu_1707000 [Sesamum angustifolium]|uniref:Uncharacterized protein n=1 Tax=Sesamum angustifolium TaxID=2727405 RepID=A0AAW2MLR0_9LAMI
MDKEQDRIGILNNWPLESNHISYYLLKNFFVSLQSLFTAVSPSSRTVKNSSFSSVSLTRSMNSSIFSLPFRLLPKSSKLLSRSPLLSLRSGVPRGAGAGATSSSSSELSSLLIIS